MEIKWKGFDNKLVRALVKENEKSKMTHVFKISN